MNLFDEVKKAETREQVVEVTRQWFRILPQIENKGAFDARADMYAEAAKSSTSYRAELMAVAIGDAGIWEGLRRYVLNESQAGRIVEPELVAIVLSGQPTRKRGRQKNSGTPYIEEQGMRYARAVWCVYHGGAGRYTLSTNDTKTNTAFSIVAQATGATFDQVRNATKDGQLNRLTRLSYLAKQLGVE